LKTDFVFCVQLRHDALIKQRASAANDEVIARRRYVAAVGAHAKGQAGAMRLCLDRLAFCASELSEQRAKRAKARTLGLGADVEADLSSTCATIERKYLEAEEGMNAVLAAGAALRWEAERVAPEALKDGGTGLESRGGRADFCFREAAALRDAFVELERPSGFFNERRWAARWLRRRRRLAWTGSRSARDPGRDSGAARGGVYGEREAARRLGRRSRRRTRSRLRLRLSRGVVAAEVRSGR
jgi:hypothetical protein